MLDILNEVAVLDHNLTGAQFRKTANYVISSIGVDDTSWSTMVMAENFWKSVLTQACRVATQLHKKHDHRYDLSIISAHRASVSVRGGLQKVRENVYATDVSIGGTLFLNTGWLRHDVKLVTNNTICRGNLHSNAVLSGKVDLNPAYIFIR